MLTDNEACALRRRQNLTAKFMATKAEEGEVIPGYLNFEGKRLRVGFGALW